jgi:hypothetical protein
MLQESKNKSCLKVSGLWSAAYNRSCPGKNIARMEIQVFIVKLLQRFRIGKGKFT